MVPPSPGATNPCSFDGDCKVRSRHSFPLLSRNFLAIRSAIRSIRASSALLLAGAETVQL
jgi:hypothetical protein